jgi:hypothetical protein
MASAMRPLAAKITVALLRTLLHCLDVIARAAEACMVCTAPVSLYAIRATNANLLCPACWPAVCLLGGHPVCVCAGHSLNLRPCEYNAGATRGRCPLLLAYDRILCHGTLLECIACCSTLVHTTSARTSHMNQPPHRTANNVFKNHSFVFNTATSYLCTILNTTKTCCW